VGAQLLDTSADAVKLALQRRNVGEYISPRLGISVRGRIVLLGRELHAVEEVFKRPVAHSVPPEEGAAGFRSTRALPSAMLA
jgi:hypothetical protein